MRRMNQKKSTLYGLLIVCLAFLATGIQAQNPVLAEITVDAGAYERNNTPVSVNLDGVDYSLNSRSFVLIETSNGAGRRVPCQLETGKSMRLWWILDGETSKNTQRTFELQAIDETKKSTVSTTYVEDGQSLVLKKDEQPVLSYRHAMYPAPEGVDNHFSRNAFIHPLYAPSGNVLTRIQPPDHHHHYGIWNPWTKTHFDGRAIDFWNLGKQEGTVRFDGFVSRVNGPVYSGFEALQEHFDLKGDTTAINELWDVRVWSANIHGKEVFLWDLTTTLNCATGKPVVLEKYRYGGGIGFRASADWDTENTRVLTSEGKNRAQADGTRARWCVTWADVQGKKPSGILFMSNPANREYPEPMRVWPPNMMGGKGNFFFEFSPIRHASWTLEPGKKYTLQYRMMVFDGDFLSAEEAEEVWNDFAHPPRVMVNIEP